MSAMRQSDDYLNFYTHLYNDDLTAKLEKSYVVNDTDRITSLTDSSRKNPVKIHQKKILLDNLRTQRAQILDAAAQFDAALDSDMTETLSRLLPSTKADIKGKDNLGLARNLVDLLEPLQVFMCKYNEQRDVSNSTMRTTRGATQEPLHIQYIQQIIDTFDEVDKKVVEENVGQMVKQFAPVTLSKTQRERTFSRDRQKVLDQRFWKCLFCQHPSVNSVPENDTVDSDNKTLTSQYNEANAIFMEWKNKQEAEDKKANGRKLPLPKNPYTKQVMKQAPKKPQLREIILLCMCKNSQCMMKDKDTGSSCFLYCLDVGTNMRCPWDPILGKCTCVVCMCQCPAAYRQSDAGKIGMGLMQLQRDGFFDDAADATSKKQDDGAGELRDFLVRAANGGLLAAANATAGNNNVSDEMVESLVNESTASMIVRNAGSLSDTARQGMKNRFGNSTIVTLPNGQKMNTTQLGGSRINLHTNNNHLGASSSTVGNYLPGMKDHQEPDYNNPTPEFIAASQRPSVASSILRPLLAAAAGAGAGAEANVSVSSTGSAPPTATMGDSRGHHMSDEALARQLAQQEQQQQYYASMPNGGGKMGPQDDIICLDGTSLTPQTQNNTDSIISTMSSDTVSGRGQRAQGRVSVAGSTSSSLLRSFAASSSTVSSRAPQSAQQRNDSRYDNAWQSMQNLTNYNTREMTSWKSKNERTTPEKEARKVAKKRQKQIIEPMEKMRVEDRDSFTNMMSSTVAPGEPTLSQTPLKASPNTSLKRLENALQDSSSSDDEEEDS